MASSGLGSAEAQVQATYAAMAEQYSKWVLDRPLTHGLFEEFVAALAALRDREGVKVLDVASASGEPAATLARALCPSASVFATDVAAEMVELGRARMARLGLRNVACERADAQALTQFGDAGFDAVTCCMGIMFVPNTADALCEFQRVLKPGGLLAMSVFQGMEVQPFYAFLGQLAADIDSCPQAAAAAEAAAAAASPLGPCRFADPSPLLSAAAAAGLRGVECRPLDLAYFLAADQWWDALCEMPQSPVKPALERAQARAGDGAAAVATVAARRQAEQRLRSLGWVQADGSVRAPHNMAWFITACKESGV